MVFFYSVKVNQLLGKHARENPILSIILLKFKSLYLSLYRHESIITELEKFSPNL